MRGSDERQSSFCSFVSMEDRIPADHPLRPILHMTDIALTSIRRSLNKMYATHGRPSIAPERLLRAMLLQVLYSVRSERLLVEQIHYNLLFRWFIGLSMDEEVWVATTFTKNRERLLNSDIAQLFFKAVLAQAEAAQLLSNDHFSVDGTYLEACASHKSFKQKDGSDDDDSNDTGGRNKMVNFHKQKRSNETHASLTDPDARLCRKGREGAKLAHHGHVVNENRHGLVIAACATIVTGTSEVTAALSLLDKGPRHGTVGGDKNFDQSAFINGVRAFGMTPHVAQHTDPRRTSRIDARTTRHPGYAVSQRRRKMIEEVFGWMKTIGLMRKLRHRGTKLVNWMFQFTAAAYNLVRMRKLIPLSLPMVRM